MTSRPSISPIEVIDSHTGGEPTRIIISGGPDLGTGSLAERREVFANQYDHIRSAIINEPRGWDAIVGGILCEPVESDSSAAVIFFNNTGYLNMCGHGTIGLVITLKHIGKISAGEHKIETPVGHVFATLHDDDRVSLRNVPSYRYRKDVQINVDGVGEVIGDIAWGGNWFFLAKNLSIDLRLSQVDELTRIGRNIRKSLESSGITGENGGLIDHIEIFGDPVSDSADSRNFVYCPGGAYDRSPCGTGTSAKLACLAADEKLPPNSKWIQESITGSVFEGSYEFAGDRVIPTICGSAFVTARSTLFFDTNDEFQTGICE